MPMPCPPEIAEVLARMIAEGLLRIRASGWSGRADLCAVEADHLHNLPGLIADYSPDRLAYYWTVERRCYLDQMPEAERAGWESLWDTLGDVAKIPAEPVMQR
jgi:hypothetical protein